MFYEWVSSLSAHYCSFQNAVSLKAGIELLSYEEIDFEEKLSQKIYVFVHLRAMNKMSAIKEIVAFFGFPLLGNRL